MKMKRFILSLLVCCLYGANVFAADTTISRAIPGKNANTQSSDTTTESVQNRSARRSTVARNVSRVVNKTVESSENSNKAVVSRSLSNQRSGGTRATLEDGVNTVGRNARVSNASINANPALRRAGVTLRASTAEVGGRAVISGTGMQTGSNIDEQIRGVKNRALFSFGKSEKTEKVPTAESIANAKDILEKTADLNSACQQQYNECMDQFCAVIDANQKRCSCSANLEKYAKVQKAVEDANAELNEVAQKIRYVGLSADEIRAIMTETEAETEINKTKDKTTNRSLLEDITESIMDPTSAAKSYESSDGSGIMDIDYEFSDDSTDLFSLDMFNKSKDISSKRGRELYNEATKRCKAVLNSCKEAGGTETQITGNYDLAIDKDCIAYEQGLTKMNQTLLSNVRSANLMLQKARLSVLQNQNEYDIKGCIGALETCMTDDMVCGENYLKCLDPTKKFIDETGKVVLGQNIGKITDFMQDYNNSNINSEFIKSASGDVLCANGDGACVVNYLMSKIGTGATIKDGGLCRAVLDRCQDYTYAKNGKTSVYKPYNDVVINYIQRAMVNIKAAQARVISNYASSCMADIYDCYNQQMTNVNSWTTSATVEGIYKVMTGACHNVALTCGYAIYANDLTMKNETKENIIQGVSEIFYQSLLCPENSTFQNSEQPADINRTISGYANSRCKCDSGYTVWGGACVISCPSNQYRNNSGVCVSCDEDKTASGGSDSIEHKECN